MRASMLWDLALYVCERMSSFDFHRLEWRPDGQDTPKHSGFGILKIFHPNDNTRALTTLMTAQTTEVIEAFAEASKAETVEEFLRDVGAIQFFKYPRMIDFKVTDPSASKFNPLEVRMYRECYNMVRELSQAEPELLVRPWPYFLEREVGNIRELYMIVFLGRKNQVLTDEKARRVLSGEGEEMVDMTQPATVRRLAAKVVETRKWIAGPGSHHRTGSGGSRGHAATETHQNAHRVKMQIRQRFAEDLLRLIEEVEQLPDASKWKSVVANAKTWAKSVLNK
jgi:hypothetical protein